ncbi:tetratricopeptide repeat (TPR)-like superfamily protein [Wolffia australiana]
MALWMDENSCPATDKERDDMEAINALKEAAAIELKEEGNKFVKMGKKHYAAAIDRYTRAINQKAVVDSETSVIFSNRAHVNLLLGNYRRALEDSEQAIKLSPDSLKAYYRAAKAAFSLDLTTEAASFCKEGLSRFADNNELKKLESQIELRRAEFERHHNQVSRAISTAKALALAIESRGLKFGKTMFRELTGPRMPVLDEISVLHWPVLLLYAEVMSSDLIEDFCETDVIADHLDLMFSTSSQPVLPWDTDGSYNRQNVELYYQSGYGTQLSKLETLKYFLEEMPAAAAAGCLLDEEEWTKDTVSHAACQDTGKWVRVNEKKDLRSILRQPGYIIPGIPVFFVVSKCSKFYEKFKSGKWAPP